jgi:glucose/arabinose dehydrogenase
LHSIAFHPDFARNGRFFAHYTDHDGWSQIAEFKGTRCRTANEKPVKALLREEQPFVNNNAGWIGFGPDGYLYIPLGDGGGVSPGDPNGIGQSKSTRLSKVLRIDVDVKADKLYSIPDSNPFAQRRQSYPRETWAMGLRNPRRASFDRKTGDLWIGDVGQDSYEEVNLIPAGVSELNFGWSDMEGDQCHNLPDCDPSAYQGPAYMYAKVTPQCGVVGGYVYRGTAIPGLAGAYLFSDFCSGFIWALDAAAVAAGEEAVPHLLLDAPQGFVSFGEDDSGELYAVALDGGIYSIGVEGD